jgi:hypothetical protein
MGSKTSIYIPDEVKPLLQKYVDRHGSLRAAIINSVQSIDTMYKIERRALRELFNQAEVDLMLNNALSTHYIPQAVPGVVLADTEDEDNAVFALYGVDRATILDKLRGLSVSQQFALVDWLMELRGNEDKEND